MNGKLLPLPNLNRVVLKLKKNILKLKDKRKRWLWTSRDGNLTIPPRDRGNVWEPCHWGSLYSSCFRLYFTVRLKKKRRNIQNTGRSLLTYGVVLLHDNTHPPSAQHTQNLLSILLKRNIYDHLRRVLSDFQLST